MFQGQPQSKRHQELQDARRRAHAARHAARKFKELKPVSKPMEHDNVDGARALHDVVHRPQRGPVRRFPVLPPIETLFSYDNEAVSVNRQTVTPLSILSQGRTDPFQTTVVGTLPVVLQRYLHDGKPLPTLRVSILTRYA